MGHDHDFEERIARMRARDAGAEAERRLGGQPGETRRRLLAVAGLGIGSFLVIVATVFLVFGDSHRTPEDMRSYASSYLGDAPLPQVGLPDGLTHSGLAANPYQLSCLRFLPPASSGWVRVNSWDARYPDLMPRLQAVWQEHGKALEGSPGHPHLAAFVQRFADPAQVADRMGQAFGTALYLDLETGAFFEAALRHDSGLQNIACAESYARTWLNAHRRFASAPEQAPLRSSYALFRYFGKGVSESRDDRLLSVSLGRMITKDEILQAKHDRFDIVKHFVGHYPINNSLALVIDGNADRVDIEKTFGDPQTDEIVLAARDALTPG